MLHRLLDIIAPRKSLTGTYGEWITQVEWRQMRVHAQIVDRAELRRRGIQEVDSLTAACTYDSSPLLKVALQRFKYRGTHEIVEHLGALLTDAARLIDFSDDCVLCPVPLHWTRTFQRGFNQSLLLAQYASDVLSIDVHDCLRRVRPTGHQAHRKRMERLSAMHDAFAVHRNATLTSHVVLIDDVATTGATLDACASALKFAGAEKVDALVVALG